MTAWIDPEALPEPVRLIVGLLEWELDGGEFPVLNPCPGYPISSNQWSWRTT